MLPSTSQTASAPAMFCLSEINGPPHTIAVYASRPPSPTATQHSLPSARYGLLGPVSHRLEHASFLAHLRSNRPDLTARRRRGSAAPGVCVPQVDSSSPCPPAQAQSPSRRNVLAAPSPRPLTRRSGPVMTNQIRTGAARIARQIPSVWKYLDIHLSPDRGESAGCRRKEARAGLPSRPWLGALQGPRQR